MNLLGASTARSPLSALQVHEELLTGPLVGGDKVHHELEERSHHVHIVQLRDWVKELSIGVEDDGEECEY